MPSPASSGINLQFSTKTAVTLAVTAIILMAGGNVGVNWFTSSPASADVLFVQTVNKHIVTDNEKQKSVDIQIGIMREEQKNQKETIRDLQELVRSNSEQLNQLIGTLIKESR